MSLSTNVKDMEKDKFTTDGSGDRAVNTVISDNLKLDQADIRLMMSYFAKMVTELEQIKIQLQIITSEEGDIEL